MSLKLGESLAHQVVIAHRIVETIVMRGPQGEVFSIEIGTPLAPKASSACGAKVTQLRPVKRHLAICLAPTQEEVFELAQRHIGEALEAAPARRKRKAA